MAEQGNRVRRPRVVFGLLAVTSLLVIVATFGMQFPKSPWLPVDILGPTNADSNGDITAIVDSESRRVLILNKNYQLEGIVNCEKLNSPIEAVSDVCVSGDTVYVAGVQFQQDSDMIVCERVVAYDMHGAQEEVLYEQTVNNNLLPEIKTMDNVQDGVFVTIYNTDYFSDEGPSVKVMHVSRKGNITVDEVKTDLGQIFDIGYSAQANNISFLNTRGALTCVDDEQISSRDIAGHVFTSLDIADDGSIYLVDDTSGSVCKASQDTQEPLKTIVPGTGYSSLHVNGNVLTLCNLGQNAVAISNLDGTSLMKLTAVMPTRPLSWMRSAVLLCRIYLAFYLVTVLILKAKKLVESGVTEGIGPAVASLVVVGVVSLAIAYTSYGSYEAMRTTRENEINLFADYLQLMSPNITEGIEACKDRDTLHDDAKQLDAWEQGLLGTNIQVGGLAAAATENGIGTYATIYARDEKGIFYLYTSSMDHIYGSSLEQSTSSQEIEAAFAAGKSNNDISYGKAHNDTTMRRLVCIPSSDGSETAGVVEIGCHLRSFEASIASSQAERIIALLVIMLVVYLTYVELRECARCFVSFGQMRHHHDSIAILTRPFSFFITLLSSIDAVMTTLIARSLIESAKLGSSSLLLALPSVMLGVGLALGQAIYGLLGSRIVIRKLMTRGAITLICAAVFAFFVVWRESFWLYCAAKLFMAIPFGLLYTLSYSLPRRADTDEVRALAAGGIKRTDTSAAALGTVLGGYAAQSLGNAWVYVLVALAGIIVLGMARYLLPETKHPLEHEAAAESRHAAIAKLLTSKTTLPIIFFLMLPAILAAGYNSFLFPLFSANLGLATSSINNLFVFGQLVVFVCISTIELLEERYDKWRVATVAVALLGVVFLLFSFNTSLEWAVVTIPLVGILCKCSDGWKAMWPRSAQANGLTTGIATGVMFSVRSVLLIVQPLVLGALLSATNSVAVVALGVVCSLCAVAFYLTTKDSALAPQE